MGGYGVKGSERVSERVSERQEGSRFISANFTSYDEGNVVRRWGGRFREAGLCHRLLTRRSGWQVC